MFPITQRVHEKINNEVLAAGGLKLPMSEVEHEIAIIYLANLLSLLSNLSPNIPKDKNTLDKYLLGYGELMIKFGMELQKEFSLTNQDPNSISIITRN